MRKILAVSVRVVRVLCVTALLVVIEAGIPAMLVRFAGWPLPTAVPSWEGLRHALMGPITDDVLLKILACPLWLLWAAFTVSLIVEAVAAARGVEIHVPMLGPMQTVAAGLIGSLAITILPMDASLMTGRAEPSMVPVAAAYEAPPPAPVIRIRSERGFPPEPPGKRVHVVERGDSLWKIAGRKLGSGGRWRQIWKLNAHRVQADGQVFTDPGLIEPGWRLDLPSARPEGQKAPDAVREQPRSVRPAQPASPAPSRSPEPAVRISAPDASASPAAAAPEAASPVVLTVEIPSGGVVSLAFAAGISTAYAASRFHRRRRRIPPPASEGISIEPEPEPAPAVKALRRAHLRTYVEKGEDLPADRELMREAFSIDVPDKLVAGRREDRTGAEIEPAGLSLGLTGPGAADAARAIVLDLLRQADRFRAEVVVGTADAQSLFGLAAEELEVMAGAVPGLTVVESADVAVERFTETHFTRSRMLVERGADDIAELRERDPGEVLPAVLLVASVNDGLFDCGVGAILMSAGRSGTGALLLGDWPPGTTCEVGENGLVRSAEGPKGTDLLGTRLFRLPTEDGAACLRQLADAHGGEPDDLLGEEETLDAVVSAVWEGPELVRLLILGRPVIRARGRTETVPLSGLQLQLFVFLALHPDGVTRDEICVALWPDKAVDVGVHDPLRHLRNALKTATGYQDKGRRDAPFVKAHGRSYRIDPEMVSIDLWDFQAAVREARAARDDEPRISALTRAAELCRGVLAEGLTCEWIDEKRNPQTRIQADVLSQLAEFCEERDPEAALDALERIIVLDPDREETWRRIIRLQLRLGRRNQARNTAVLLRERLHEMGVSPVHETERLLAEVTR
ncbi:BTAD domain-containing putative transcriptional regulator [Planobispora rosea]|uniref:BTAD domain-containing putative transcriptional regulator n=1 Tax=Planobispora rosea TaxID=35762 RepID=UPI00083B4689|nr:BTAD domain-containing putative transcriptional regulator [Planobispora rosea]